jgi:hypothetical protein
MNGVSWIPGLCSPFERKSAIAGAKNTSHFSEGGRFGKQVTFEKRASPSLNTTIQLQAPIPDDKVESAHTSFAAASMARQERRVVNAL